MRDGAIENSQAAPRISVLLTAAGYLPGSVFKPTTPAGAPGSLSLYPAGGEVIGSDDPDKAFLSSSAF